MEAEAYPQPPVALTEEQRRARLRYMGRWATGLLIAMGGVYVLTRVFADLGPWVGYVRAFAEAAMVGALADWFATTALFRHPLGLPIPHTAIVPRKKDRIGDSLGRFVLTNFLSRATLSQKLEGYDFASKGVAWLLEERNRQLLAHQTTQSIPRLLAMVDDEAAQRLIRQNLERQLQGLEISPIAHSLLGTLTQGEAQQELLTEVVRIASTALVENKEALRERLRKETPWYVPRFVDNNLAERIVERTEAMLRELNREPDHPVRLQFAKALAQFVDELKQSPSFAERLEQIKTDLLTSPSVSVHLDSVWATLKANVLEDAASDNSAIRGQLLELLQALAERVVADARLHAEVNAWVRNQVLDLAESQRQHVAALIATTVKAWDRETVIDKLELQVGRDLQFIRINGTLVGGLVGLLLHLLDGVLG